MSSRRLIAALAVASLVGFVSLSSPEHAAAQEEVEMTPTPTPTPEVPAIPTFPEGGRPEEATAVRTGGGGPIRIDSPGMFGAGFMIGNTSTGATGKLWFTPEVAMQFSAGSGPLGNNVRFQLDVLYHYYKWVGQDDGDTLYVLPFYVGVGGQAGIFFKHPYPDDRTDLGVRVPVGMSIVVPDNPVEIYFEVAPDLAIYDDANDDERVVFYVDGQIGIRYYF